MRPGCAALWLTHGSLLTGEPFSTLRLLDLFLAQWLVNGLTCEVMYILGRQECNFVSEGLLERGYELLTVNIVFAVKLAFSLQSQDNIFDRLPRMHVHGHLMIVHTRFSWCLYNFWLTPLVARPNVSQVIWLAPGLLSAPIMRISLKENLLTICSKHFEVNSEWMFQKGSLAWPLVRLSSKHKPPPLEC